MGTYPNDAVPLAHKLQDVQDALLSAKKPGQPSKAERDRILLEIIDIMADPSLNVMLDRICGERRR